MKIIPVDPQGFTPTASEILRAAWKPPCIDYSREYLAWQFGFPSDLPPIALGGYEDDSPVAFVAATGRLTNAGPIYMSSFMSTIPGTPSPVAIAVVRHQQRALKRSGVPTLVFAQKGSVGERLLAVGDTVGLNWTPLGDYRVHAAAPRSQPPEIDVFPVSSGEWVEFSGSLGDDSLLSLGFEEATVRHLESDPFRREFLLATSNNVPWGSAMLSDTATVTSSGIQFIPTLHCIRLRREDPALLLALLFYARIRGPIVNVPNVVRLSSEIRKVAGLRATPSVFVAYIAGSTPSPYRGTEFEIV